jgi:hypothetical protein
LASRYQLQKTDGTGAEDSHRLVRKVAGQACGMYRRGQGLDEGRLVVGESLRYLVQAPGGQYQLSQGLTISAGVTLQGVGWNTIGSDTDPSFGSWICVEAQDNITPVTISGPGGAVRDIAFKVAGQTPEPPSTVAPMVYVQASDTLVENVFMLNPHGGIYIDGNNIPGGAGRVTVRRLFGEPLTYGIQIDGSADTNYIDSIHFWPYWAGKTNAAAYSYQLANGKAIILRHCDNPHISNVFASFYSVGLSLEGTESATSPHKVHLGNADFDCCVTGVSVQAMGDENLSTNVQLANVTAQAPQTSDVPRVPRYQQATDFGYRPVRHMPRCRPATCA